MSDITPTLAERYAFRDTVVSRLIADLQGPSAEDEVIDENPLDRYITGILWPAAEEADEIAGDPDFQDDVDAANAQSDEASADIPVAGSRMSAPSSVGLTFTVSTDHASIVTLRSRAARYVPLAREADEEQNGSRQQSWQRVLPELDEVQVGLGRVDGKPRTYDIAPGLQLYVLARVPDSRATVTITAVLRNVQPRPEGQELRDGAAWFQVGIEAVTETPAIVDRRRPEEHNTEDPDLRSSHLLYHDVRSFAAGHGCAAYWDLEAVVDLRVDSVKTVFLPRQEVHRAKPSDTGVELSLESMYSLPREDVLAQLERLCGDYETWIGDRERGMQLAGDDHVPEGLRPTATQHMHDAREALARIRNGIELLRRDDIAFEAFQLANEAMHHQRSRQDWNRRGSQGDFALTPQKWRPFQIAFVLLNLPSITDRDSDERGIADLLWFPAGGGKTEAYLALIAYLIVLRRLRDSNVEGTAVIMRYTLRLLTIQQFERASMLICSLEYLRRDYGGLLGERPFGIGLWVGGASTPNNLRDAGAALRKLANDQVVEEGNPMQLEVCPWDGTQLAVEDYQLPRGADQLVIRCPSPHCEFHGGEGLPVHLVDEDVYRVRPELVIGTVDKFAQMAWNGQVAALFGRTGARDIGPDLIVQDELHLISGPLGSTVGLFEAAVDLAAGRAETGGTWRPKVIASTATIRRSEQQIGAVFDRQSKLFPPPGLAPDTSFFAEPSRRDELGTREYVGVMAPGTSHATLMVRTYASLLETVYQARGRVSDQIIDPYWTLIGYFNSLRVLGSAYLQVQDDVGRRLELLARRDGLDAPREVHEGLFELTSRRASSEIPTTLKALENPLGGPRRPLDVVIATNMISVGLDVDRLGLMTVMGQPPSSSEYIQATSRIGRKHPGLVVTIFNSAKSRDRSHYESFTDFHRSLYRAVEATSATPFATRSRDRALHAMFVAALRMTISDLRDEKAASNFDPSRSDVRGVVDRILDRVNSVAGRDTYVATQQQLDEIGRRWLEQLGLDSVKQYRARHGDEPGLLMDAGRMQSDPALAERGQYETPWATPSSMRDIDAETVLRPVKGLKRRDQVDENNAEVSDE